MLRHLALALLATATASVAAQAAATTERYQTKGDGADAYFQSFDECSYSYSSVYMSSQRTNANGTQYVSSGGWLNFSSYNYCTGESTYGWADLTGMTFSGQGWRGAQLTGTASGFVEQFLGCEEVPFPGEGEGEGESGGYWQCFWDYVEVPVAIDLTWTAGESSYRGMYSGMSKSPDSVSRYRSNGTYAYGTVTGTLTVDGQSLSGGDYSGGTAWSSTSGSMYITHFN